MAIYRQIQTTFWQDDFVLSLTPEEKFFYIYFFTNSKTKQCGIYELPLKIAEVETGYSRETVVKNIQKFIEFGKIAYDWETKELAIKNWIKYNPLNNPKIKECVEKELEKVKNRNLITFIEPCLKAEYDKKKYPYKWVSQQEQEEEEQEEIIEEESCLECNIFSSVINPNDKVVLTMKSWEDKELDKVRKEYFTDLLPIDAKQDFIKAWVEWCDYRKEIKHKLTPTTARKQIDKLLEVPNPVLVINESISNGWQGLFTDKYKGAVQQTPKPKEPSVSPIMKMMLEANGIKTN